MPLDFVRTDTLLRLYDLHKRSSRDSRKLDLIDAALSLTLGDKRAAETPSRLIRNVLRDAERIAIRAEQHGREAAAKYPMPDAGHRRSVQTDADGITTVEMVSHDTPESHALADETLRELIAFAETIGAHGPRCLSGLLRDLTAAQTSATAGVSVATVERAWKALRIHARVLLTPVAV